MNPIDLLKAEHVGIRELKTKFSKYAHSQKPIIATDHGRPVKVLVSYDEMVTMLHILGDLMTPGFSETLRSGRKAIEAGANGIDAKKSLRKLK